MNEIINGDPTKASTNFNFCVPAHPQLHLDDVKCEQLSPVDSSAIPSPPLLLTPASLLTSDNSSQLVMSVLIEAWNMQPRKLTIEKMLEYMENYEKYDCVLQIFHARVAQKSYGNEKRFISPPPCVYMLGDGWAFLRQQYREMILRTNPALAAEISQNLIDLRTITPTVELGIQKMRDEWFVNGEMPDDRPQTPPVPLWVHSPTKLDFSKEDYCAAKSVYISDSERLKYFKLAVRINIQSIDVGMFPSERIKVISKPSKKKQSMKNADSNYLCITSGKKVALFNRLRSQTVSTRYLHCDRQQFYASGKQWGAFTIHLVDIEKSPHESKNFHTLNGYIQYGSIIKLVDSCTGMTLPRLIVRKIDKNKVFLDENSDEPVSQLHKCAFQFYDNRMMYLALVQDSIAQYTSKPCEDGKNHEVCDGASWTIISTEKVEYRFFRAMGPTFDTITPIPVVDDISFDNSAVLSERNNPDNELTLFLAGQNFTTAMKVWFGAYECRTFFQSNTLIECLVPEFLSVLSVNPWILEQDLQEDSVEIPIYVVRDDGVIYATSLTFTYQHVQKLIKNARTALMNVR